MESGQAGGRRGAPSPSLHSGTDSLHWRVLTDPFLPGFVNMARDHALALSLRDGEGALRFYRWNPPTISFGRNEPAADRYAREKALMEGVAFVRRPTGGRAVLHDQELTYALVFPVGFFGGLKKAYRAINQGLLAGLRKLGAAVRLADSSGPSLRPDAGPCFRQPAEGEVMARGRKLIGSAQVRIGTTILQHGSILLDGDQKLLSRLRGNVEGASPPATLRSVLGGVPDVALLRASLLQGLEETLGGSWGMDAYRSHEKMAAERLEAHYEDPGWTWRV